MIEDNIHRDYKDLLSDLNSSSTGVVFRSLCALKSSNIDSQAFELLKNIAENATTFKNKKIAFALIIRHFPNKINSIEFRLDNNLGYIYFIQEKLLGHIKIGRSSNLEKRLQIFATDLPFEIELVHYIKSYNYEKIELEFHKHFKRQRVNGEWFKLSDAEIFAITKNDLPDKIKRLISTNL